MPICRNHANPAAALDAEQLVAQPPASSSSSASSQNKRRQPLVDGSNNNNNNNGKNQDDDDKINRKQQQLLNDDDATKKKLLSDNVNRLLHDLYRFKNEQVEMMQANYASELNNTQNIYASSILKIPRNIKSMTLAEFNAVYKTDLLATLLQRPPDDDDAAHDDAVQEELELDPMEQTLQMGTVLKGGRKQNVVKKPAVAVATTTAAPPLKGVPPLVAVAAAAARPIGPAVAAAAASFQHGAAAAAVAMGGNNMKERQPPIATPSNTKRPPVAATPSGRQARHGEVLFSKNGSPVEAGPARGAFAATHRGSDTYIVATVTKKKRRGPSGAPGAGAQKQGEEEESVMAFGIDVGGGEYISLQDATVATQLDPAKKNAALFQLQQLKEQVDTVMKNLQINNNNHDENGSSSNNNEI